TGMAPAGLDEVLAPFGVELDDQLVHDLEPSVAIPDTHGEGYFVAPHPHPVTTALVPNGSESRPPRVAVFFARSLHHASSPGAAWAAERLTTTDAAYDKRSIAGASAWTDAPPREASDSRGPFVVAMASERPAPSLHAAHGPRVVVVGSRYALLDDNWRQPRPL